jgi:hypothetical protein
LPLREKTQVRLWRQKKYTNRRNQSFLGEDFPDDSSSDVRQTEFPSHMAKCKPRVIHAEAVEHGGLQVVDMDRIFGNLEPEVVRSSDGGSRFDPAARQPHRIGIRMMVPPAVLGVGGIADFNHWSSSKLATPNDESGIEQSTLLEVLDEGRGGLIRDVAVLFEGLVEIRVLVPTGVHEHHKADAAFDHAAGEEAVGPKLLCGLLVDAIHIQGGWGFL